MSVDSNMDRAIAVTRFGLGARPGEMSLANAHEWLSAQIRIEGADQPQTTLPGSRDRFAALLALRQETRSLKQAVGAQPDDMKVATGTQTSADEMPVGTDFKTARRMAVKPLRDGVRDEIFARTVLATATDAPFRERWTLFWANHFTVSTAKLQSAVLAGPFEREAIRPHVFGRFEDLLVASTTHPGMLMYLDQIRSAGPNSMAGNRRQLGLNENLAREIMELHTLGADAGYTQADVTEFARALTGYSVGAARDGDDALGRFLFRPLLHEPGMRTVMGKSYSQPGAGQAHAILADLAASPKTAQHLARQVAVHFVADDPPPVLVEKLRTAYLHSNGDLAVMAQALIAAPESWAPQAQKLKTPIEFIVSSYRAAGVLPRDPAREIVQPLTVLGQRPFAAPQPNGWSDIAADWAAPGAVVKRLDWASRFAQAYAPVTGALTECAEAALGARLTGPVRTAIARAETRSEAFAVLLMSPEFQRR